MKNRTTLATSVAMCLVATLSTTTFCNTTLAGEQTALSIVVMDPLAAPLSCPCVEGYAQRDYTVLAKFLEQELGVEAKLTFATSLEIGIEKAGGADIIIGKQSVVEDDLSRAKRKAKPVYLLTDLKGSTVQRGLIVVNKADPAQSLKDLAGYTIIFGSASASEKHDAAIELLKQANVEVPQELRKVDEACSDGACKVIDLGPKSKTAAVISSYAQPLLEGCGTIKKGDLRVVGETQDVPFIAMFLSERLDAKQRTAIDSAIKQIPQQPHVLEALESLVGFLDSAPNESAEQEAGAKGRDQDAKKNAQPATIPAG